MLKEVIVVEGKSDIQRIHQAIDADCIATEGFTLRKGVIEQIRVAYEKRGIIILTDPDTAGFLAMRPMQMMISALNKHRQNPL